MARVGKPAPATGVGNERKAAMSQAFEMPGLKAAVKELHDQHPIGHSDRGPHHSGSEHLRHMPLHGLKSRG